MKYDDPEIHREDSAVISVIASEPDDWPPIADDSGLHDTFPYASYFPAIEPSLVKDELRYWSSQLIVRGKLQSLIGYLRENPLSKRAVILFWDDACRDLTRPGICEIAATFRLKNGRLSMHTHMRANNASFLLFMDMRVMMGVQRIVATALGAQIGEYLHFIDSLHVYEREVGRAAEQLRFMESSPLWRDEEKSGEKKNVEVELRGLLDEISYRALAERLESAGTEAERDDKDTYFYDVPSGIFKICDEISKNGAKLSAKIGKEETGAMEEIEIPFDRARVEDMRKCLSAAGLTRYHQVPQKRTNFSLDGCVLSLKHTPDFGFHFELEGKPAGNEDEAARELLRLQAICERIGISPMTPAEIAGRVIAIKERLGFTNGPRP